MRTPVDRGAPRLGLCCVFVAAPIRFRTATATALLRRPAKERGALLAALVRHNAGALAAAVRHCAADGIGAFRVTSSLLPLRTHPAVGYDPRDLPGGDELVAALRDAGSLARRLDVRLTFHPDQFVVLSSPRPEVVASSLAELEHHAEVAELIGADVVNLHGGGGYGDRPAALTRWAENFGRLSPAARRVLTLENDDRVYPPADLLPLCERLGVPFVYDVHHHRCRPDGLTVAEVTRRALATWDREPIFHLSSPIAGWGGPEPRRHHDFVDLADFPVEWRGLRVTVDVEAKSKELAVRRLRGELGIGSEATGREDR